MKITCPSMRTQAKPVGMHSFLCGNSTSTDAYRRQIGRGGGQESRGSGADDLTNGQVGGWMAVGLVVRLVGRDACMILGAGVARRDIADPPAKQVHVRHSVY